jgi:hypothetical protein
VQHVIHDLRVAERLVLDAMDHGEIHVVVGAGAGGREKCHEQGAEREFRHRRSPNRVSFS